MKRILFLGTLLSVLMFSLFTSCKKDDADDDFQVRIENYSNETVSFYVDGKFQNFVQANYNYNQVITFHIGKTATFEVRSSSGKVLDSKVLRKGDSYVAIINPSSSDEVVSDTRDEWTYLIEIVNNSSTPIHVFINGRDEKVIAEGYRWTTSHTIVNQSNVPIQIKTSDGKILDSKTVSKGGSYVKTINDPTFTITKIVLTKWYAGNWLDNPDPWFEVSVNGTSVGRTNYLSDRTDGEICTWSNLNIRITKIYSKVALDLYDYNMGYSSVGSSYIGGVYTPDFSEHWGQTSFEWSTSKMAFTIYGTWN